ncbi:HAD family hydrolase [Acinetobacter stercoris]|uniref:Phosphoglycolate phosphatase n=1 Tax=Acinetobacter stercoris TaxID=2126983 RepID=A0A2U3MY98_9GAMM|nr:HAD family phosphatase [Acinetobacter stercoris]SPL70412.1 Phosphoglycolate phosphatase [Acinetobacter stercoris]
MFQNKKLICFDLDGTLIDSVGVWNQIDAELINELSGQQIDFPTIQQQRDEQLKKFKTLADPYLEYCGFIKQKYQIDLDKKVIKERRYGISYYFLDHVIDLKPKAEVFLNTLKSQGVILALTTTTSINNVERYRKNNMNIQQKIDIKQLFSLILTREDVENIKPHPEMYLKAIKHFNVSADECLIIEDSLIGVEAANCAKIDVAAIYDQYSAHELEDIKSKADYFVESYDMFLERLKNKK